MTDDHLLAEFATRINEVCDDKKVPPKGQNRQQTVAKLFGVTQKGARKWLEGEGYPAIGMANRIAAWGGVHFEWLMTGRGPKTPDSTDPLRQRYAAADVATRKLIDLALADAASPMPDGLSPSLRVMIEMVRTAIRNELRP